MMLMVVDLKITYKLKIVGMLPSEAQDYTRFNTRGRTAWRGTVDFTAISTVLSRE